MEHGRENLKLAESALRRALDLNPDLPNANSQYAFLEAELGRAEDAVARLLRCIKSGGSSPELYVALVLACRFCGLLETSVVAHEHARLLDPLISTSVNHTYYQLQDYDAALSHVTTGGWGIEGMTLGTMGRTADGLTAFRKLEESRIPPPMRSFIVAWRAMFEGNYQLSVEAADDCIENYLDPEGLFYMGLILSRLGESERALTVLGDCIDKGFSSFHVLRGNPWFEKFHGTAAFSDLLKRAETNLNEAEQVYRASGGPELLGQSAVSANTVNRTVVHFDELSSRLPADSAPTIRKAGLDNSAPVDLSVGREPELNKLQEMLTRACAGTGRLVFITGETGIGKTTLANQFASGPSRITTTS